MKKLLKIGIIINIVLLIIFANISTYASTVDTTNSSAKSEILIDNVGENQIQVTVSINNLVNIGEGINAYVGILDFNSNELEFVEFKNVNNWNNPSYKILDNQIKVVSTSNKFLKEDSTIFQIIFNKKVSKDSYNIQISKLELAAKVNNETIKVMTNTENTKEDITSVVSNNSQTMIIIICLIIIALIVIIYIILKKFKGGK